MNELQSAVFSVFCAFDAVCKKLGIPYFLVCGSALGAVKYQGFIPWDDDLDVGMLREDYDRFLNEAPAHLPEHLFLQTAETDPAFPQLYAKLRDSRTTFLEKATAHLKMHHGIYMDIFPLDRYPAGKFRSFCLEAQKRIRTVILLSATEIKRSARAAFFCRVLRLFGFHRRTQKTVRRLNRALVRYANPDSPLLCNHGNWQGTREYAPVSQYNNGTSALFEGVPVKIPEDYDAYLTQKYGNWRDDPPEDARATHHTTLCCDTARPYTDFVSPTKTRF